MLSDRYNGKCPLTSLDSTLGSDKFINGEDKIETTKTDAEISAQVNCGGNDRRIDEAKPASVDDEQMQWTNGETTKDCAAVQNMDVSLEKEQCG